MLGRVTVSAVLLVFFFTTSTAVEINRLSKVNGELVEQSFCLDAVHRHGESSVSAVVWSTNDLPSVLSGR